jgi:4-carboxymuconolactone decarboxylase
MRFRSIVLILTATSVAAISGQTRLPADIHPESLSRLPPVQRADLDEDGKRIWDAIAGGAGRSIPKTGPGAVTMHSPKAAEPIQQLNQILRKSVVGPRFFELSALIAAREFDSQYEWSGHEPQALKVGLEQSVIDVVKFNRDVTGLADKDATVIRLGRAIFRDHKVPSELWAKAVEHFGRQGAFDIVTILGDYAMAEVFLTAVDQQLPPERKPLLPVK